MSRDSSTFKESYNRTLDMVRALGPSAELPTESALSQELDVSRTTVRGILGGLDEAGIITWSGRRKTVLRRPKRGEYFQKSETAPVAERLSSQFMEFILNSDLKPGAALHESELMKQFNLSSTVVREFLIHFSRFGLIRKERNRGWVLRGFTRDFAEELFDVREMFELRAFSEFLGQDPEATLHQELVALREPHEAILSSIDRDFLRFPRLDEKFHRIWIDAYDNRFVTDFFELITLVFHYHYRWNRSDEKERNHDAILEHLRIIDAVESGDFDRARSLFQVHLGNAKKTMIASALWT